MIAGRQNKNSKLSIFINPLGNEPLISRSFSHRRRAMNNNRNAGDLPVEVQQMMKYKAATVEDAIAMHRQGHVTPWTTA